MKIELDQFRKNVLRVATVEFSALGRSALRVAAIVGVGLVIASLPPGDQNIAQASPDAMSQRPDIAIPTTNPALPAPLDETPPASEQNIARASPDAKGQRQDIFVLDVPVPEWRNTVMGAFTYQEVQKPPVIDFGATIATTNLVPQIPSDDILIQTGRVYPLDAKGERLEVRIKPGDIPVYFQTGPDGRTRTIVPAGHWGVDNGRGVDPQPEMKYLYP